MGAFMKHATKHLWLAAISVLALVATVSGCNNGSAAPPISLSLSPNGAQTVDQGQTKNFTATVTNDSGKGVTWTLTQNGTSCSPGCGTIAPANTQSGAPATYTAPAVVNANLQFSVTATSVADVTKSVTDGTTLVPPPALNNPAELPVAIAGQAYSYQLKETGGVPPYTWSIASGSLPQGFTLDSSTGVISGNAAAAAAKPAISKALPALKAITDNFTVQVLDSGTPQLKAIQALSLTVNPAPAPTIVSLTPNSGSTTGGTTVTITGTNFQSGLTVTFGNAPGTSVSVLSASIISVVTPVMTAGPVNVVVINPDGQTATDNGGFTANAPPTITSISPTSGPAAGGTSVTITGMNFKSGATVTFGGNPGTSVVVVSATSITVVTPTMTAGPVNVVVINPDGQTAMSASGFTAVAATSPTITSISPMSGPAAGGTSVTITGMNFKSGATVTFGGNPGTSVVVVSATSITVVTPTMTAGPVNIVVINPDGQTATSTGGFTAAVVAPPPTITSINPNSGPAAGGTSVTITGTNFKSGATVTFGGKPGTSVVVVSATRITAVTPTMTAGPVNVVVTNPDGQSANVGFTFTANSKGTTTTAENRNVTMSASNQTASLFANVFVTSGGPVTEGTVTFTIKDGSGNTIGAPAQSGTITNSFASASYTLPGATPAGTYTINAVYNAGPDFSTSSDNTHTLKVNQGGESSQNKIDLAILETTNQILTTGHNTAFQLTVTNLGSAATQPITVADTLPAGMTYIAGSANGTGWDCSASTAQMLSCTTPKLIGFIINYIVNVTAPAGTVLKNTATVSVTSPDTDADLSNNSSTDTETVVAGFLDLGLSISHTGQNLMPGINTVYMLNIVNNGTEDTTQPITVGDTLPSGLTFISASGPNWNCSAAGQAVTCHNPGPIQAFDPGTSAVSTSNLALIVSVARGTASPVMDSATVSVMSPDKDANPVNNTATDSATIGPLTSCDFETSGFGPPNSNGNLQGYYTYFFSGYNSQGDHVVRAGSFFADGNMNRSTNHAFGSFGAPASASFPGEEDLAVGTGSTGAVELDTTPDATTGIPASNYCLNSAGGSITLQDKISKKPVTYRVSGAAGAPFAMIEFDPNDDVRGSGIMVFQGNPGLTSPVPIPGLCDGTSCAKAYVFEFSGRDTTVFPGIGGGPMALAGEVDLTNPGAPGEDWFNDPLNTTVGGVLATCTADNPHCLHNSMLTATFTAGPDANGRVEGTLKTGAGTGPADQLKFAGYILPALKYFGEGTTTGNPIEIFAVNLNDKSADASNEKNRVLGGTIFAQSQDPSTTPYTKAALTGSGAFFYAAGYDPSHYTNSAAAAGFALFDTKGNVTYAAADFDVGGVLCPIPGEVNPTCPAGGTGTYNVGSNGGAGFITNSFGGNFTAYLSNINGGVLIDLSPSVGIGRIVPGAFGSFPALNVSGSAVTVPPALQASTLVTGPVTGGGCQTTKTTCSFNLTEDVDAPGTGLTIGLPETVPSAIELGSFCTACAPQWDGRFALGTAATGGKTDMGVLGVCPSPPAAPGPHDVCMIGYGTGLVNRNILIDESTTNPVVLIWGFPVY
jgi:uncharacterized repeat protein (TIGR01451 family)